MLHFVCRWSAKPEALILPDVYACSDAVEIATIKWRNEPVSVKLIWHDLRTPNAVIVSNTPNMHQEHTPHSYPLLKSNLQKQIRRQDDRAVDTAASMMSMDTFELLRRLIVITIEDVTVHLETSVVAWLMAAVSKKFVLDDDIRNWILGYVQALVKYPTCKRLNTPQSVEKSYNTNLHPTDVIHGYHTQKYYITGILMRTAYGGTISDCAMISQYLDAYLQSGELMPLMNIRTVNYLQSILKVQIIPSAVDYHVDTSIIYKLATSKYSADTVKAVIWTCSSSINNRAKQDVPKVHEDCWNEIKDKFFELALTVAQ